MVDKVTLDALAVVLRDERTRTEAMLKTLKAELSEEQALLVQAELDKLRAATADLEAVLSLVEDSLASIRDGAPGKDGADGKDGENGKDGKDGLNGLDGAIGERGLTGDAGIAGKDGADGSNGRDGRDGADGSAGRDGIDRDMVTPFYPAPNDVLERGSLAYSEGGLYQAIRNTIGSPLTDPFSYRLVLNGLAKIVCQRDDTERITRVKTILSDGTTETVNIPDGADGRDGERGPAGETGTRGRKGLPGAAGVGIDDVFLDRNHVVITLTNGETKTWKLEIPPAQITHAEKMQGVHDTAPTDPPLDYLWVSPDGRSKIWSGKNWIKLL